MASRRILTKRRINTQSSGSSNHLRSGNGRQKSYLLFRKTSVIVPVACSKKDDVPSNISSRTLSNSPKRPQLVNLSNESSPNHRLCQPQAKTQSKGQISPRTVSKISLKRCQSEKKTSKSIRLRALRNSSRIKSLEKMKEKELQLKESLSLRVNRASRQAADLCQQGNIKVAQTESLQKMLCLLNLGLMPNISSKKIQPPFVVLDRLPRHKAEKFKLWQESWINSKKMRNQTTIESKAARKRARFDVDSWEGSKRKTEQKPGPLRTETYQNRVLCKESSRLSRSHSSVNNSNIENEPRIVHNRKVAETIASRFKVNLLPIPRKRPEGEEAGGVIPTFSIVTKLKKKEKEVICIDLTDEPEDTYFEGVKSRLSTCATTIHLICP